MGTRRAPPSGSGRLSLPAASTPAAPRPTRAHADADTGALMTATPTGSGGTWTPTGRPHAGVWVCARVDTQVLTWGHAEPHSQAPTQTLNTRGHAGSSTHVPIP